MKKDIIIMFCIICLAIGFSFTYFIGYSAGESSVWNTEGYTTFRFNDNSRVYTISDMWDGEQDQFIIVHELITNQIPYGCLVVNQTTGQIEFKTFVQSHDNWIKFNWTDSWTNSTGS